MTEELGRTLNAAKVSGMLKGTNLSPSMEHISYPLFANDTLLAGVASVLGQGFSNGLTFFS